MPKADGKINVAVTGVHAGCGRAPGLAVANALARHREFELTAIDYDCLSTGLDSGVFHHCEVMPWSENPCDSIAQITRLKKKLDIHVFFPCLNIDVELFSKIAGKLDKIGIRSLLPKQEAFKNRSKINLKPLAELTGLRYPRSAVCNGSEDLARALDEIGCPCVLKGRECGVYPVRDEILFEHFASVCQNNFGFPVIVQEWIEGEEFSVVGLFDSKCHVRASLAVKKIGIGDDGESWMSVVVDYPDMTARLKAVAENLSWTGPIECDFVETEDGVFLLDVNPRFPDWIDGPASLGFDMALAAVRLALDEALPHMADISAGTVFFKDFIDICKPVSVSAQANIEI